MNHINITNADIVKGISDEEYINWLKLTKELLNKYNLKDIKIKIKEISSFDKQENKIVPQEMLQVKIIDVHNKMFDNALYIISKNC